MYCSGIHTVIIWVVFWAHGREISQVVCSIIYRIKSMNVTKTLLKINISNGIKKRCYRFCVTLPNQVKIQSNHPLVNSCSPLLLIPGVAMNPLNLNSQTGKYSWVAWKNIYVSSQEKNILLNMIQMKVTKMIKWYLNPQIRKYARINLHLTSIVYTKY